MRANICTVYGKGMMAWFFSPSYRLANLKVEQIVERRANDPSDFQSERVSVCNATRLIKPQNAPQCVRSHTYLQVSWLGCNDTYAANAHLTLMYTENESLCCAISS